MKNEVIFDGRGIPDIMVSFTPDELGLPAELKGRKVEAYLIAKYPATMIGGVPHSLPYQKPAVNVTHDEAIQLCEAKGPGWHLITNDEWAALAHQSRKNGTLPRGNTASGKSHSYPEETGTTYEDGYGKTLTGSGPVTWNHDHTAEGVADMCGNVWEHVGGIRFVDGKVQVIGADPEGSIYSDPSDVHQYDIEGVGEDFYPKAFDRNITDDIVQVTDREAFEMTRRLAAEEGLLVGGSSGMAVASAIKYALANDLDENQIVVVLAPDSGRSYLEKIFNDDWMRENGYGDIVERTSRPSLAEQYL